MNNFYYDIPTKVYFGKGAISNLKRVNKLGKSALLVYGGGSIKRNGIYQSAIEILKENQVEVFELSGVEPNPRIETVREGVFLCREHEIDVVIAIGGGSTIDCSKIIAAGTKYDGDPWDLVLDGSKIKAALPIVTVLTVSATGSEMDAYAVISDMALNEKIGTGSNRVKPTMSILDPEFTYSVPKKHTAAGTIDIMSHTFESYFNNVKGAFLQAKIAEGILKTCIKYGPIALNNPEDYEARANLMWASSLAINGMTSLGADVDWSVHGMEHELSAFYDITHGDGLAILTPFWMEYVLSESTAYKFYEYGVNVWGIDGNLSEMEVAKEAINKTRDFFKEMGLPSTLTEVGIDREHLGTMAHKLKDKYVDSFVPLSEADVLAILESAI